jgi:GT2 family glycosyltransferase
VTDVSVVVATTGTTPVLDLCAAALARNTLRPRELVLVDGSPDGAGARLEAALSGSGVELNHLVVPRCGVSRARNRGIAAARCDLLAFTDDDCVPADEWLAALVTALEERRAGAASGRVLPLPDDRPGRVAVSSRTDERARVLDASSGASPWEAGTGGNLLLTRRALEVAGGFDEAFGPGARFRAAEDVHLLERLLATGATIAYAPAAVVYHETKTPSGRLRRRLPYGYGLGAAVASAGPGRRATLARRFLAMQARLAASGARGRSGRRVVEPLLGLAGFGAGAAVVTAERLARTARGETRRDAPPPGPR